MSTVGEELRRASLDEARDVARAFEDAQVWEAATARGRRVRRVRMLWRMGAGLVAATVMMALAGVWLLGTQTYALAGEGTAQRTPSDLAITDRMPVTVPAVTVGWGTEGCGRAWEVADGVSVHAHGAVPPGTIVSMDVAGGGQVAAQLMSPDSLPDGLTLRVAATLVAGGVVVGEVPEARGKGSEQARSDGGRTVLAAEAARPGVGECGGETAPVVLDGAILTVVAQLQDASSRPVATWVVTPSSSPTGPIEAAGVGLACGDVLPERLPADRPHAGASWGPALSARVVSDAPDGAAGWAPQTVVTGGGLASAQLRIAGADRDLTYVATVVQAVDGVVVSSTAVEVRDGSGVWDDARDGATPLLPGHCQEGEADPVLIARASGPGGAGYDLHAAVVAIDAAGRVVGHWFDPEGLARAYVPDREVAAVDGWCPAVGV